MRRVWRKELRTFYFWADGRNEAKCHSRQMQGFCWAHTCLVFSWLQKKHMLGPRWLEWSSFGGVYADRSASLVLVLARNCTHISACSDSLLSQTQAQRAILWLELAPAQKLIPKWQENNKKKAHSCQLSSPLSPRINLNVFWSRTLSVIEADSVLAGLTGDYQKCNPTSNNGKWFPEALR